MSTSPIGVFDSGMGGLTVLKALKQLLPGESFIYLGDTARLPYGTKSTETVKQYAVQMAKILLSKQVKALVIACNTATTAALSHLQLILPELPIMGVVKPGSMAVIEATKTARIKVLATETTIASNAYQRLIKEALPEAVINVRACSVLVALAEEGMINNKVAQETLMYYLSEYNQEDTILLGCTHFPVFKPLLASLLPSSVTIVDSAVVAAQACREMLLTHGLLNTSSVVGSTHYLVTDSVRRFQTVGEIFLGEPLKSESIELVDALQLLPAVQG